MVERGQRRGRVQRHPDATSGSANGLRGAVSLALALLIDSHPTIDNKTKDFVLIQTAGVVTLSLLINGTTAGFVYEHLQLYRKNRYHEQLIQQAMACLHDDTTSNHAAA